MTNYTLTFYTKKLFFDTEPPQDITESFTDFSQCVLRTKELMYKERNRLKDKCFPDFNCLIKWEDGSLRCDSNFWGYSFRICSNNDETHEHLWKLIVGEDAINLTQ